MDGLDDEVPASPPLRRAASSKASFCSRDSWMSDVGDIDFGDVGLNPLADEQEPAHNVPIWANTLLREPASPEREQDLDLEAVTIARRPRAVTEPALLRPKTMLEDSPVNTPVNTPRMSDSRAAAERTEEHVR